MLYGWSDIVMALIGSVRYPVLSSLRDYLLPCPPHSSMRSHPLPSRGGVRGGVCNVSNILSAKSGGEEVSAKSGGEEWAAKKWQQRSGSKEVAAKKWQQRSGSKEHY